MSPAIIRMNLRWEGTPQVSVEDIIISGRIRVIMKPLLDRLPLVGALQVPATWKYKGQGFRYTVACPSWAPSRLYPTCLSCPAASEQMSALSTVLVPPRGSGGLTT